MTRTLIIILASLMLFPFKLNAQNFKPLNEIIMKENFDDLSVRLNIFLRCTSIHNYGSELLAVKFGSKSMAVDEYNRIAYEYAVLAKREKKKISNPNNIKITDKKINDSIIKDVSNMVNLYRDDGNKNKLKTGDILIGYISEDLEICKGLGIKFGFIK